MLSRKQIDETLMCSSMYNFNACKYVFRGIYDPATPKGIAWIFEGTTEIGKLRLKKDFKPL